MNGLSGDGVDLTYRCRVYSLGSELSMVVPLAAALASIALSCWQFVSMVLCPHSSLYHAGVWRNGIAISDINKGV